jgi:hypothetical protein
MSVIVISLTHDLPSSLVLSLPLENRYPRGFSVYPAASQLAVFALSGFDSFAPASSASRPSSLCRGFPSRSIPVYVAT